MHFNHTISAILRGTWLIDPLWAQQHAVLAYKLLQGETVDFGTSKQSTNEIKPVQLAVRGYKIGNYTQMQDIPEDSVAIVDLIGPVIRYGGMCAEGLEDTANLVRKLNSSDNIASIVFNVNSPGGEASGTAMFAALVKSLKKPTIGIVDDGMAASAAMWIISACDEVYATNSQSQFGSIGAYTVLADFFAYYEMEGLPIHQIYAPQSTDKNKDYRDALAGNYAGVQEGLAELVDYFIGDVKANRGGKLNIKAGDPFTGKMFSAKQAKKIGLIDGIMSMEQAIGRASQLASTKSSTQKTKTKMATENKYPNLAKTAGWVAGYESTDEGIHITHDEAALIETALTTGVTDANSVKTLTTERDAHAAKIVELSTALSASQKEAKKQRALAEEYGAESAEETATIKTKDDVEAQPKVLDEVTEMATKLYNANRHKAKATA